MRRRKKPLPELPTDFTNIRALPVALFAAASEQHEESVRRQVAAKKLETIKISANKTLVVLTDEHRLAFQALAALRSAQPPRTSLP
jgi:hypothetical protein